MISGRSPELGKRCTASSGDTAHVANSLYDQNYHVGIRTSDDVLFCIEGNYSAVRNIGDRRSLEE
jgi:hypothetical protein